MASRQFVVFIFPGYIYLKFTVKNVFQLFRLISQKRIWNCSHVWSIRSDTLLFCLTIRSYLIDFARNQCTYTRAKRQWRTLWRRSSDTTKCSKITSDSWRGGGRALFVSLINAILRGRTALFQAATQPPEPPSIPKYPGWLLRRASNTFLCCADESVNRWHKIFGSTFIVRRLIIPRHILDGNRALRCYRLFLFF